MKLVFVNIMQELQRFDSTAYITQPPVPLALLNGATPPGFETSLVDEQTDPVEFAGDAFAFSVSTQNARAVYEHADRLRAGGGTVILGGIHVTVCPDEAAGHADSIVTGEAETIWPTVCADLLAGALAERYTGSPTPPPRMTPVDYRFFAGRRYLTPAALFATRGCPRRCSFCVSSRHMGPYRTKPLWVVEQEIDQLAELYPGAFLQFSDDNLLALPDYRTALLALLRRKRRRFVTMVTVDQLCDVALLEELAASGCLGVAVGVESLDDENCAAVGKYQNLEQPFAAAVRRANALGIQTGALIMVGLPLDTPERLVRAARYLRRIPCSAYDVRVMRVYPSTPLYRELLAAGAVTADWWLEERSPTTCNHLLPSSLSMHFRHPRFDGAQLQRIALELVAELNRGNGESIARILRVGQRGRGLRFAATTLFVRRRLARQARGLLRNIAREQAGRSAPDGRPEIPISAQP